MFDLDQRIALWRATTGAGGLRLQPGLLDELEDHLRSRFAQKVREGLPPEQAFERALGSLGTAQELSGEFAKLEGARSPLRFLQLALLVLQVLGLALVGLMAIRSAFKAGGTLQRWVLAAHVWSITAGYVALLGVGLVAAGAVLLRLVRKLSPGEVQRLRRSFTRQACFVVVTLSAGLLLGMVWSWWEFGRAWSFDPREVAATGMVGWSMLLVGLPQFKPRTERWLLSTALAGSLLTILAWFGPPVLLMPDSSQAFSSGLTLFATAALALHGVFGALVLLPAAPLKRQLS